jgi:Tfp pilus assembly protein PilO
MKKLPKIKRDRLVLIVVSTLIVLMALWQGLINIQKRRLVNLSQRVKEEETRVNNAQRLVASTKEIQKKLSDKAVRLKAMEGSMASGDMYSWIILKINQFKGGYDVDIPQFSREVPTEVGVLPNFPYRAALFNIRGKAYYHDFGRFLSDFENAFPYLRVQNIDLEPASSTSAANATGTEVEENSEKLSFRMEIVTLINPNAP